MITKILIYFLLLIFTVGVHAQNFDPEREGIIASCDFSYINTGNGKPYNVRVS